MVIEACRREYDEERTYSTVGGVAPMGGIKGFFLCWTRKEAYINAKGAGMRIRLTSFEVSLTPDQPEVLRNTDSSRWTLRSLHPTPGYVGAVVGEGKHWELRLWDWSDRKAKIKTSS